MTINESISSAFEFAHKRFHALIDDLTPDQFATPTIASGNSLAWIVGHVTLVDRSLLKAMGAPLPEITDPDFDARYGRGSKGGTDSTDPKLLVTLLDAHVAALTTALRSAPPELFDRPMPNHPLFSTVGVFASMVPAHTLLHGGQISMIRRTLGRPPLF